MNEFSQILIDWYRIHHRDLPWRHTKDPYKIWISEIILQQTRVAQGRDYFLRFIDKFPDVNSLAMANEDEVLKLWQGLGYYSRARNLHQAAKSMNHGFPKNYKEVRALKGVGDYTAAAICSIGYDLPYAVVDGNVYRVLARWLGLGTPIDSGAGKRQFAQVAFELLNKEQSGLHNQAIMEFGALQCIPSNPDCQICPLCGSCVAYEKDIITQLPVKERKVVTSNRFFTYIYVRMSAYTYINRRQGSDIWKNMFEFPLIETGQKITEEELLAHPFFRALTNGSDQVVIKKIRQNVKHILSHRIIYADFYEVVFPEDFEPNMLSSYLKVSISELGNYAMPKLMTVLIESLSENN